MHSIKNTIAFRWLLLMCHEFLAHFTQVIYVISDWINFCVQREKVIKLKLKASIFWRQSLYTKLLYHSCVIRIYLCFYVFLPHHHYHHKNHVRLHQCCRLSVVGCPWGEKWIKFWMKQFTITARKCDGACWFLLLCCRCASLTTSMGIDYRANFDYNWMNERSSNINIKAHASLHSLRTSQLDEANTYVHIRHTYTRHTTHIFSVGLKNTSAQIVYGAKHYKILEILSREAQCHINFKLSYCDKNACAKRIKHYEHINMLNHRQTALLIINLRCVNISRANTANTWITHLNFQMVFVFGNINATIFGPIVPVGCYIKFTMCTEWINVNQTLLTQTIFYSAREGPFMYYNVLSIYSHFPLNDAN